MLTAKIWVGALCNGPAGEIAEIADDWRPLENHDIAPGPDRRTIVSEHSAARQEI